MAVCLVVESVTHQSVSRPRGVGRDFVAVLVAPSACGGPFWCLVRVRLRPVAAVPGGPCRPPPVIPRRRPPGGPFWVGCVSLRA